MGLQAQQWNGSGLPTGDVWRAGNVGVGYTGIPTLFSNFNINGDLNFENTGDIVNWNSTRFFSLNTTTFPGTSIYLGGNSGGANYTNFEFNTLVGTGTGFSLTTSGHSNTFVGHRSGFGWNNGEENTIIGAEAARDSGPGTTQGKFNTFLGYAAGELNNGIANTYLGHSAGGSNAANSISDNTYVGYWAGSQAAHKSFNTLVGSKAGRDAEILSCTGIGHLSLAQATTLGMQDSRNIVAVGVTSGHSAAATGNSVFIGDSTGYNSHSASGFTFVGYRSGFNSNLADGNTFLGSYTGQNVTTEGEMMLLGTNTDIASTATGINTSTAIGYEAEVCASNTMVLGYSNVASHRQTVVIGDCAPFSPVTSHIFQVNGEATKPSGGMWQFPSDRTLKKNIQEFELGISVLNQIEPKTYYYKESTGINNAKNGKPYVGVIAQDIEEIDKLNELAVEKGKDGVLYIDPNSFLYILINSVKQQQLELDSLKILIEDKAHNNTSFKDSSEKFISERSVNNNFKIYPNPANDFVSIDIENYDNKNTYRLTIVSIDGSYSSSFQMSSKSTRLDVKGFKRGTYILSLLIGDELVSKKMLLK